MTDNSTILEGSRTGNSIKNVIYAIVAYIAKFLASFFFRMFYIRTLGNMYAGVEGVFQAILYVISLADLGLEGVMSFYLYTPIAYGNRREVSSIMYRYRKYSFYILAVIMLLGLVCMPFLPLFIAEGGIQESIYMLFFAYTLSIALDSFNKYQKTFINACQKQYVTTLAHYLSGALMDVLQIVVILTMKNFLVCLYLQALGIVMEWFLERMYIKKKYGNIYILFNPVGKRVRKEMRPYLRAVSMHKASDILLQYGDNLIVSVLYGITVTGIYANYRYILYALNSVFFMVLESCAAAIGELVAKKRYDDQKRFYYSLQLINSWIYGFAGTCLYILMNPFITLWLGEGSLFPELTMILIVLKFYFDGVKKGSIIYRDAMGLFIHDRFLQYVEVIIIALISFVLYLLGIGIEGVLIAAIAAYLMTEMWYLPGLIFRKGLGTKPEAGFYLKGALYFVYMIASCAVMRYVTGLLPSGTIGAFIIRFLLCMVIPNLIFLALTCRTAEFRYVYGKLEKHLFSKFRRKAVN